MCSLMCSLRRGVLSKPLRVLVHVFIVCARSCVHCMCLLHVLVDVFIVRAYCMYSLRVLVVYAYYIWLLRVTRGVLSLTWRLVSHVASCLSH